MPCVTRIHRSRCHDFVVERAVFVVALPLWFLLVVQEFSFSCLLGKLSASNIVCVVFYFAKIFTRINSLLEYAQP